jgi:tRNA modification GTPase
MFMWRPIIFAAMILTSIFMRRVVLFRFSRSATFLKSFSHGQRSLNSITSDDTIYALSSGPIVKSGVAIVRISGPRAFDTLQTLISNSSNISKAIKPRYAALKCLYDPETGDLLDEALVLWFPGPRSFTGEDVVELQVHGSRAVISGVFDSFRYLDEKSREGNNSYGALRPANPGEFTRRAFERGKMDLTEVEGLSDLLASDTKLQRKQALKQVQGSMRKQFEEWRALLLRSLAHSEAVIDFGG